MGCNIRTTVPIIAKELSPRLTDHSKLQKKEREMREILKKNFDSHHKARSLKRLDPGVCLWLPDMTTEGKIINEAAPRSYIIETPSGTFRRNQRHIIPMPVSKLLRRGVHR